MPPQEPHLSDQQLLRALDAELSPGEASLVQAHIAACWTCRTRKQEIEAAISDFVQIHRRNLDVQLPAPDGPRALLKARMAQLAHRDRIRLSPLIRDRRKLTWAILSVACALLAAVFLSRVRMQEAEYRNAVTTPDPNLTPGAIVLLSQGEVCTESSANDKPVPLALTRRVFGEYGIKSAEPGAYQVDYLITPALGGADDIHNLWPQSRQATLWNAQVKDALEEHLRNLVCSGRLDLATAQRDMATNWIEAYKKYFHTDRPLIASR